jgi:hypothetical protein
MAALSPVCGISARLWPGRPQSTTSREEPVWNSGASGRADSARRRPRADVLADMAKALGLRQAGMRKPPRSARRRVVP